MTPIIIMDNNTIDCISYVQPSSLELFIPSNVIFSTLCVSTDKTNLFIVSVARLLVWIILYYVIDDMINYEKYKTLEYLLVIMIFVNILYIGVVVAKNTVFSIGSRNSMFTITEGRKKLS
jgi:ABC-type bacteriocin/lantibiotic exporter with double-glycine peptidase domain